MNDDKMRTGDACTPDIAWCLDFLRDENSPMLHNKERSLLLCTKQVTCETLKRICRVESVEIDDIDTVNGDAFDFLVCDEQNVNRIKLKDLIVEGGQLLMLSSSLEEHEGDDVDMGDYLERHGMVVNQDPIELEIMSRDGSQALFLSAYSRGRDCADTTCNSPLIEVNADGEKLDLCETNCGRIGSYHCPQRQKKLCTTSICSTCFMRNQFSVRQTWSASREGYDGTYMDMVKGDIVHRKGKNDQGWSYGWIEGTADVKYYPPEYIL